MNKNRIIRGTFYTYLYIKISEKLIYVELISCKNQISNNSTVKLEIKTVNKTVLV